MLRSGYSSDAVAQELSVRHFAEFYDATVDKALKDAGASPALIEAIRTGSYQSSSEDAAAAKQKVAVQAERNAIEKERLRKSAMIYQAAHVLKNISAPPTTAQGAKIADMLKGDLVYWKNGSVAHFDDEGLEKKQIFALYFSAKWCPPCRKFTPQLVDFYKRMAPQHPEFEVVFVSYDRSPFGMETYLSEMPWPAIEFGKVPNKETLKKYSGDSIPCLVVVDSVGKVLFDTYVGEKYMGPEQVLTGLNGLFAQGSTVR